MSTGPLLVAVHENQTEWPPGLPAGFGSPGSLVASLLVSWKISLDRPTVVAPAKSSFCGLPVSRSENEPASPLTPSTAIR